MFSTRSENTNPQIGGTERRAKQPHAPVQQADV